MTSKPIYLFQVFILVILSDFTNVVNNDADNGWTTILDKFKKNVPKITQEASEFLDLLNSDSDTKKWAGDGLVEFAKECDVADETLLKFLKDTSYSEKTLENYQQYMQKANSATSAFSATLKSVVANMAIMLAINIAAKGISLLINEIDNYINRLDIAKEKLSETEGELDSVNSEIVDITARIKELESMDTLSLTDKEELERLREENKELAIRKKYLEDIKKKESEDIVQYAKEKMDYKYGETTSREDIDAYKAYMDNPAPYDSSYYESDALTLKIAQYERYKELKEQAVKDKDWESIERLDKELQQLEESLIEDRAELQGFKDDLSLTGESSAELDNVNQKLKFIDDLLLAPSENLKNFLNSDAIANDVLKLKELASNGELTEEKFKQSFSAINSYLEENNLSFEDLISTLEIYRDELGTVGNISPISFDYESFSNGISEIQSAYDTLSTAVEEYNTNGAYSLDTVNKLLELKPEYLALLVNESGQLAINEQGLRNIVQAQLEKAQAEIYATGVSKLNALAQQEAGNASTTAGNDMVNSVGNINAETEALSLNAQAAIFDAKAKSLLDNKTDNITDEDVNAIIAETENQVKALQSAVQGLTFDVGGVTGGFKSMGSAAKGASKSTDALTESMKKQKEALESTKSELEKQKQYYEDVAEAIDWFYDKQIEKQEKAIDSLEKENELLEERIDYYDGALSAIDRYYEKQIEKLEKQKDALAGNNKEAEIALNLEKRRQELLEAKNRKSILQYESGKGFSYTTDNSAIKTAEENLADAQRQKEEADIDAKIDKLKEYQALWTEIPSAKQKAEEESQMIEMLGANWESILLEGRIQNITSFKEQYIAVQQQIDSNESLIASYEEKIEYYEALKTEWDNLLEKYTEDTYIQLLVGAFGNDYENELLNGRTLRWEQFAEDYYNIQVQLKEVTDQIETLAKRMEEYASRIESAANSAMDAVDNLANMKIPSVPTVPSATPYQSSTHHAQSIGKAYAKGGIITKKDAGEFDVIAHKLGEDHMIAIQEGEAVIPKETVAKNPEAIDSLLSGKELDLKSIVYREGVLKETTPMGIYSLLEKYQDWITPESAIISRLNLPSQDFSKFGVVNNNQQKSTIVEFKGDIVLQGVQDVNGLARDIKYQLANVVTQELGRA